MTDDFLLDHRCKGYPLHAAPCRPADLGQRGWNVLAGDLPLPIAVIRESALAHNLAWMQAYAERKGVALAPHGKTTMSPQLFGAQLANGAWGMTLATAVSQSTNTVAVRLADTIGRDQVARTARRLGIESPVGLEPAMALGAVEFSPLSGRGPGHAPAGVRRVSGSDEVWMARAIALATGRMGRTWPNPAGACVIVA
eukprot:gene41357-54816_t